MRTNLSPRCRNSYDIGRLSQLRVRPVEGGTVRQVICCACGREITLRRAPNGSIGTYQIPRHKEAKS